MMIETALMLASILVAGDKLAVVVAESQAVFDRPSDAALVTGELGQRGLVAVRRELGNGWLAIVPPTGQFGWVDAEALESRRGGEALVVAPTAVVRAFVDGAKLPGAVTTTLRRGAVVRLIDRKPLVLRQGGGKLILKAIEPTEDDVRYVRVEGMGRGDIHGLESISEEPSPPQPGAAVSPVVAGVGAIVDESKLPEALRSSILHIEVEHRAALRRPPAEWRLDAIRLAYERLLAAQADATARRAIQSRIDRVSLQEEIARVYLSVERISISARARDQEIAALRPRGVTTSPNRPFDVEGLLLASSKQVDGRRVYMLIGPKGETSAYLSVPPGLEAERLVSRRVGARGRVRYNEALGARHVEVDELEPLGAESTK